MKIIRLTITTVFFFLICLGLAAQTKSELENKKKKTLEDIKYTNKLLQQTKSNQKESYNNLLLINNKIESRQELISDINAEVLYVDQKIEESELIIRIMEEDLVILKGDYAEMIKIAWKNQNKYNDIMFILAAEDFNQTYLRLKYMQQLADFRKKQFKAITSVKAVLLINVEKLALAKEEKKELLNEEIKEGNNLKLEQKDQEKSLTKLKGQEQELKDKLKKQQNQMAQLQREIAKLIAEEAKKSSGSSTGKYELTPAEKIVDTNFGNNKGRLPWPVERGVIVGRFGKQNHPILTNVVIDNKGIDISTTAGSDARCVFEGEVRKVLSIPGAQNAVMIRHGQYLSVYTHLDNVYVSAGDYVVAKQAIGSIHTDLSENETIIHLEIWKASTTLNPSSWLAK